MTEVYIEAVGSKRFHVHDGHGGTFMYGKCGQGMIAPNIIVGKTFEEVKASGLQPCRRGCFAEEKT